MALSQDTVKEIFVATALASETTLKTFEATASDGEIGVFKADGSDGTTVGDFIIVLKLAGSTIKSDLYKPSEIQRLASVKGRAFVPKVVTVTPTALAAGTEYILEVRFQQFGSLSPLNFYSKFAQFVVPAGGATATQIANGLRASLAQQFSKESGSTLSTNAYFTFGGTATLVITEKEQPLELGKDEGRPIVFDVIVKADGGVSLAGIVVTNAGYPGTATGKQVAIMEDFYRGNRGDQYRDQHFPYNWGTKTKRTADVSALYSLIDNISIKEQKEMFNVATGRKGFVIAVPNAAGAGAYTIINSIITKLAAVSGRTVAALTV